MGCFYDVYFNGQSQNKPIRCKFIKVTRKGFNLLNVETDECLMRQHLYAKGYGGKPLPPIEQLQNMNITIWLRDSIRVKYAHDKEVIND